MKDSAEQRKYRLKKMQITKLQSSEAAEELLSNIFTFEEAAE